MEQNKIYFGNRDRDIYENSLNLNILFSNKASLNFWLRHYWSVVEYKKFYELLDDGNIIQSSYSENHNINYNSFSIDLTFKWNFAPGSELLVVWKNNILDTKDQVNYSFFENLSNTIELPQTNVISFKFLYYLDGSRWFKRKLK